MNIILVLVTSANGKLTHGESPDVSSWTSSEDKAYFASHIQSHSLIIMGRKTYEVSKSKMQLIIGKLRIVMTKHPEQFIKDSVSGQLEFTDESPEKVIQRLEKLGYINALLVGGTKLASQFFKEELVNTISLTIEPKLFGSGIKFFDEIEKTIQLKLEKVEKLNDEGTLLLHYKVLYSASD